MHHHSGETAKARGVYHSACKCRVEVRVRVGDRFPVCPRCKAGVLWNFTRGYFQGGGLQPPPTSRT